VARLGAEGRDDDCPEPGTGDTSENQMVQRARGREIKSCPAVGPDIL